MSGVFVTEEYGQTTGQGTLVRDGGFFVAGHFPVVEGVRGAGG